MPEPAPRLRAVAKDAPPPRRRGPGLAVLVILLYAAAFGAGLWWCRSRSPLFQRSSPVFPSPVAARILDAVVREQAPYWPDVFSARA